MILRLRPAAYAAGEMSGRKKSGALSVELRASASLRSYCLRLGRRAGGTMSRLAAQGVAFTGALGLARPAGAAGRSCWITSRSIGIHWRKRKSPRPRLVRAGRSGDRSGGSGAGGRYAASPVLPRCSCSFFPRRPLASVTPASAALGRCIRPKGAYGRTSPQGVSAHVAPDTDGTKPPPEDRCRRGAKLPCCILANVSAGSSGGSGSELPGTQNRATDVSPCSGTVRPSSPANG